MPVRLIVLVALFVSVAATAHALPMSEWEYISFSGITTEGGDFGETGAAFSGSLTYDPTWDATNGWTALTPTGDIAYYMMLEVNNLTPDPKFGLHLEFTDDGWTALGVHDALPTFITATVSGNTGTAQITNPFSTWTGDITQVTRRTPVPEPATGVLLLLGAVGLGTRRYYTALHKFTTSD